MTLINLYNQDLEKFIKLKQLLEWVSNDLRSPGIDAPYSGIDDIEIQKLKEASYTLIDFSTASIESLKIVIKNLEKD